MRRTNASTAAAWSRVILAPYPFKLAQNQNFLAEICLLRSMIARLL